VRPIAVAVLAFLLLAPGCSLPADPPPLPVVHELPGLTVHITAKKVVAEGRMLAPEMPLELLLCAKGGKEHESAIVCDVKPQNLHYALLLIGLKPGSPGRFPKKGPFVPATGEAVDVTVSWTVQGKRKTIRAEKLAWSLPRKAPMRTCSWTFVGSYFLEPTEHVKKKVYAANESGSLITTFHDPSSVLENPFDTVLNDSTYEMAKDAPPAGTPVRITFRPKL
jgi:hypothetical protein